MAGVNETATLLHGEEELVLADAGYTGAEKREELKDRPVKWCIALKRGRLKAQIRARAEHPFPVVKNLFAHRKVRYKGLKKNTAQCFTLFALANLVIAKKHLLA